MNICFFLQSLHVHNSLALSICHEIYKDLTDAKDSSFIIQIYLKSLSQLDVSLESECFLQQLQTITDKIEKVSFTAFFLKKKKNLKFSNNNKI